MLIQDLFGIIQNLQMSHISQTSFLVWTFFCHFLQQTGSSASFVRKLRICKLENLKCTCPMRLCVYLISQIKRGKRIPLYYSGYLGMYLCILISLFGSFIWQVSEYLKFICNLPISDTAADFLSGVVHKLHLQDEVGRWSKKSSTIENVQA